MKEEADRTPSRYRNPIYLLFYIFTTKDFSTGIFVCYDERQ